MSLAKRSTRHSAAHTASSPQRLRIIGGQWRSRLIPFPVVPGLRPTGDRVRETLFNWLGQDLSGLTCIDVFAGSGALGFEAASRGAKRVLLCETHSAVVRALEATRAALDAPQVEVLRADGLAVLQQARGEYDVVFADPPFADDHAAALFRAADQATRTSAFLYLEQAKKLEDAPSWRLFKHLKAGAVHAHLFHKQAN